jgi:transcriptional regulator with XRE-family HTH domain
MIGDYLKKLREEKNLSLRAVERQAKVNSSFLSKIERGMGEPGPATLRKLSKLYLVPYEVLMEKANMLEETEASVSEQAEIAQLIREIEERTEALKRFLIK